MSSSTVFRPLLILVMLVLSSQSTLFLGDQSSELSDAEPTPQSVDWHFIGGSNTSILNPVGGDLVSFPHEPGFRPVDATLDMQYSPDRIWSNDTFDLTQLGGWGTFNNTVPTSSGFELLNNATGSSGFAGSNNFTVTNQTFLSGNHSYDVLHLLCGIVSCGEIIANGSLQIHARKIILEAGTKISGDSMYWGGTGVGGNTQQTSSGLSDGAGGAGHHGSGGDGGASGGTASNGGSSYGNGTENGSSGGNVSSSSSSSLSTGGRGGGNIELYAVDIEINGTISVDGENGDHGAVPPGGTGSGGSGAGGGSAGSLRLQASTIYVGQSGVISAAGGDGGDGANGACAGTGPCLFLYHGGHGGGGGSGGNIRLINSSNGYTNNGVVTVSGGSGGAGGLAYGTGSAGTAGSSGGAGSLVISGFAGYAPPAYLLTGTWISPQILIDGGNLAEGVIPWFSYSEPIDTDLSVTFRTTIDNQTWSEWESGLLSGMNGLRSRAIQFKVWFNTSANSTTPALTALHIQSQKWDSLSDLTFMLTGASGFFGPTDIGVTEQSSVTQATSSSNPSINVPVSSTPNGDGWILIEEFNTSSGENLTIMSGANTILDISKDDIPLHGYDLLIEQSSLISEWPTSGTFDSDGIEWGELELDIVSPQGQYNLLLADPSIAYNSTIQLDFNEAMDAIATSTCGDWYLATSSCLPAFTLEVDANATEYNATLFLNSFNIDWIDDIAPQLDDVWFEVGGSRQTTTRHGALLKLNVQDTLGENSISVETWLLENPVAANLTSVVTLGSSTTAGAGASDSQTTAYVPLLEDWLQENNSQLMITNLGQGGARVTDYQAKMTQIQAAQPEVVTFLPFGDYANTPVSQWWSDYVPLLEEIEDTGAHILFFDLRIEPQYVCGNGSGPGGCYSASEAHGLNQKNDAMAAIAANLSNITLIPFNDTNAAHPEWNAMDGHPNDTGHSEIAQRFKDSFVELLMYDLRPTSSPMQTLFDMNTFVYHNSIPTSGWNMTMDHHLWASISMEDESGNSVFYGAAAEILVVPIRPKVFALEFNSSNGPLDSDQLMSEWWHNESIDVAVGVDSDRYDLNVSIDFSDSDSNVETVQLQWDEEQSSYVGTWDVDRRNLGTWNAEVFCVDYQRSESDGDGYRTGIDATLTFIDKQPPLITGVSGAWTDSSEQVWRTYVDWESESGEAIDGSVSISMEDGSHYRTLLLVVSSDGQGYADLSVATMAPGIYWIDVALSDESGNPAPSFIVGDADSSLTILPPLSAPLVEFESGTWDGWNYTLSGTFQNESEQPISLQFSVDNSVVDVDFNIIDDGWSIELDMRVWLAGEHQFNVSICDDESRCSYNSTIVDSTSVLAMNMTSICQTRIIDSEGLISGVDCEIRNDGIWDTEVRVRLKSPASGSDCSQPFILESNMNSSFVACELIEDHFGNVSVGFYLESLDVRGEWVIVGEHDTILLGHIEVVDNGTSDDGPADDGKDTKAESSEAEVDQDTTALWVSIITAISVIAVAVLFLSRRGSKDTGEVVDLWGEETPSNMPKPMDQDLAVAIVSSPDPTLPQNTETQKPQWVAEWNSLPAGGSYSTNDSGQWYQDGDGDWWLSAADGSWNRHS